MAGPFTLTPPNYGKVVGRFIVAVGDGVDSDVYPDGVVPTGTVTFTPSASKVLVANGAPDPVTLELLPIVATIDSSGYLSFNGATGVWLVATDDVRTNPSGFTYKVTYNITYSSTVIDKSTFDIAVPASSLTDATTWTDLTKVTPVQSSPGTATIVGPAGPAGPANSLSIGTVTTGTAAASVTGAAPNQVLNLVLPSGGGSGTVKTVSGLSPDGAGNVALTPSAVGLANVNNTSDANKPVSGPQAIALSFKADDASVVHQSDQIVYSRRYSSGVWPVRGSVPAGSSVQWLGPSAPPIDGTYALAGVDTYTVTVS